MTSPTNPPAPLSGNNHSRHQFTKENAKRILIHNARFLFTADEADHILMQAGQSLVIEDGIIAESGPAKKFNPKDFDYFYDANRRGGTVITPGFINTHAHCHMYLMRSAMMLDEGEGIDETIDAMAAWQKYETDEALAVAAIGDITEQQKSGITTTLSHGPSFGAIEEATIATGHNTINAVSAVSNSRPDNTPEAIVELLKNKSKYKSIPAVAIHYLYKAPGEVLEKIKKLVDDNDLLLTFHMAESQKVVLETLGRHGLKETAVLKKYGLLNSRSLASHVLHVETDEIIELAAAQVGIAHLPTSNAIHKSGIFKYWDFDAAGGFARVALGTDSVVSKSRLDLLSEAYQARITHLYNRTIKFGSLFKMLTVNGARVLRLPDRGKLLPGYKADLAFWKIKDRGFIPYDENRPITLLGNLITHGGRAVRDLMVNGQFVIKDRRHTLVNESQLLSQIQNAHMEMRGRIQ